MSCHFGTEMEEHNQSYPGVEKRRKVRRHLPPGKGPYTVGTVDLMCDHTENGSFFRLFYPTRNTDIYTRDKLWPLWIPRKQYGFGYMYFLGRNPKIFGKWFNWMGGDVYVPALWQAPILQNGCKFPVIVMSHGLGGNRTTYTTLCLELASQGFIVAAVEHRDGSASMTLCLRESFRHSVSHSDENVHHHHHHHVHHRNSFSEHWKFFEKPKHLKWDDFQYRNKQMHHRAGECSRVLDIIKSLNEGQPVNNFLDIAFNTSQFKNTMDLDQASIIGHSFGGSACLCTLSKDKRFKVGIVLDGWMHPLDDSVYENLSQPLLLLNMDTFQWKKNILQMKQMDTDNVERLMLTIRGTCHQTVSDFQFLTSKAVGRFMNLRHTLSPRIAMDIVRCGTLGFLTKHLEYDISNVHEKEEFNSVLSGDREHVILGTNIDLN